MEPNSKEVLITLADQTKTTGAAYSGDLIETVPADFDAASTALAGLTSTGYLGADGIAVYGCIFLGKNAFGVVDVDGGNLEVIVKTPEEAGGPLNQFGTIGVYFETGGGVLYEERLLRVECGSFYSQEDEDDDA